LFFFQLGGRDLTSSHEARAAQNAQSMLDTGEWGLPVAFDGTIDLQKPPGYYWLAATAGWLNGGRMDAWTTRLPAAIAGFATVLLVFGFLRKWPAAARMAAMILATAVHFTAIARTARIDVPLTCAVAVSLIAFYRGCDTASRHRLAWHALSAVAAAAGVMLKGPVALALIGPAAVAFLLIERLLFFSPSPRGTVGQASSLSDPVRLPLASALLGLLIVAALALPWFLWANRATGGDLVREFFWHHNIERFAGTSAALATHPWWYYVPRFAVDFLPWTPALVFLIAWSLRTGAWRHDRLFRFGLVWFATMFVVLSAAGFKRADYLLPLYPGAAIAFGCAAEAWRHSRTEERSVRRADRAFAITIAAVLGGWMVMIFVIEPTEQAPEEKRAFAEMIRKEAPQPQEIILFRMESHLLAFHLGRPLVTLVEWHDLNDRLAKPGPHYVVMPPEYVYATDQIVRSRKLRAIAKLEEYTAAPPEKPLVFLRTVE
jgi:4-amino-4-deoxy-L-arabinose transferase-like glycosyltransferase